MIHEERHEHAGSAACGHPREAQLPRPKSNESLRRSGAIPYASSELKESRVLRLAYLAPRSGACGPKAAEIASIVDALERLVEVERFGPSAGLRQIDRPIVPKRFDRILGVFENEADLIHGVPVLRQLGGVAALYGWSLARLACGHDPALLDAGGWRGSIAAWRHGGMSEMRAWRAGEREGLAFNRSVVRWADGFMVESRELAQRIQDERNAPTAIQILPLTTQGSDAEAIAQRWVQALTVLPTHRSGAKSLIATAIAGADAARAAQQADS